MYRLDGRGGAAYDPQMMLALLVCAYCVGERSSRRIEMRLVEDVAFRAVAANQQPDHATIARFRGMRSRWAATPRAGRDRRHEAEREPPAASRTAEQIAEESLAEAARN